MDYFDKLYEELIDVSSKIRKWYDIDKVKTHSVYIWTKGDDGDNVFDILSDEIYFYDKTHIIIEEARPAIKEIQQKLKEIEEYRNLPAGFKA
jgi:hypothetical protein